MKTKRALCAIIESEHGTITSVVGNVANVQFENGRQARIPLTGGKAMSHRWLHNFRRDVRTRRDNLQGN